MGLRGPKRTADAPLLLTTAYPIYDDFWTLAQGGRRGVERSRSYREGGAVDIVVVGAQLPGEPDTVIALLEAETVRQVHAICRKSAWMAKQPNCYLAQCLPRLARQFLDAKRDRRYPRSDRNSSIPKKFWFLACALAGAMYGLSLRRAINLIGPGKPEEIFRNIYEWFERKSPHRKGRRRRKK